MDIRKTQRLAQYLAREYSEDIFRLLLSYRDISASEAASRLNMHIRTIQEYLEVMADYHILEKREVSEGKRPYFRYTLKQERIDISIDLRGDAGIEPATSKDTLRIRERKNSGIRFTMARNGDWFSTLGVWEGDGREGRYRRINLTTAQGKFFYNLPFPDADALSIEEILEKAGLEMNYASEVRSLVEELIGMGVLEVR